MLHRNKDLVSAEEAHAQWARWRRVLRDEPLPAMIVDLDALDANLALLLEAMSRAAHSPSLTLRLATKSLRCPALARHLLERGGARVAGLMTSSAAETALYAAQGFDDLVVGYPAARRDEADALAQLAADGVRVVAMVDCAEHVALLDEAARRAATTLEVCIDVDGSLRLLGARLHLGVRRSPVRDAAAATALARAIAAAPALRLVGIMLYEAQVAGLADHVPQHRAMGMVQRSIKALSRPRVAARRLAVLEALRADGHELRLVNGGGTGSVASTAADPSVTELTAGSGFYAPRLFDHYDGLALRPAAFFALAVARRSDAGLVTCAGGGFIASGPPGPDRAPAVYLPRGLEPLAHEGFGEVQTPLRLPPGAPPLELGDPVLCRHAKAGEPMTRFAEVLLVRGESIVDRVPTVRGLDPRVV